jgi:hypothetical protein
MFSQKEISKAIKHAVKVSKKMQDEVLGYMESDEAVIIMSAVRYMLGRGSYGVGTVCGYLIKHEKRLSPPNKEVICRDIVEYMIEHPDMKYKENWAEIVTRFTDK